MITERLQGLCLPRIGPEVDDICWDLLTPDKYLGREMWTGR